MARLSDATCKRRDGREVGKAPPARLLLRALARAVPFGGPAAAWAGSPRRLSFFSCPALGIPHEAPRNKPGAARAGGFPEGKHSSSRRKSLPEGPFEEALRAGSAPDEGSPPVDKDKDVAAAPVYTGASRTSLRGPPPPQPSLCLPLAPGQSPAGLRRSRATRAFLPTEPFDEVLRTGSAKRAPGGSPAAPSLSRALRLGPIRAPLIVRGPQAPRLRASP